jgi:hypothetical protein
MKKLFVTHLYFLVFLSGCTPAEPTAIATLNNSSIEMYGDFTVGGEKAPFANGSIHIGTERFDGGEQIVVNLKSLWSDESHELRTTVPKSPGSTQTATLSIEILKDLSLNATWKQDRVSLEEKQTKYFLSEYDCLPLIINNRGRRLDYTVRVIQGKYSLVFRKMETSETEGLLSYGFLHQGKSVNEGLVLISYLQEKPLQTSYFKLQNDFKKEVPDVTAVYVSFDQQKEKALVYLLRRTKSDPLLISEDIRSGEITLPKEFLELPISRTDLEIQKDSIRIPDLDSIGTKHDLRKSFTYR